MNTCVTFCQLFTGISWLWYGVAVAVVFIVGALWYGVIFPKAWQRVYKVEMPERTSGCLMARTMLLQLICTAFLGLGLFVVTHLSVWAALLALLGFCAWDKGNLNFQFPRLKDYFKAAGITVGYTWIAGIIFIFFATL